MLARVLRGLRPLPIVLFTESGPWDANASHHHDEEDAVNLHAMLLEREAAGRPVRIGLIGAGKFGTMFLTQVRRTSGMHLVGLADLNIARAHSQWRSAGGDDDAFAAPSLGDALRTRRAHVTADADALIAFPDID